ncbi:MAG: cupin domain-containing protein [Eubacteriales bacterium]|nr:cupin domain-containing protein [Eubacteriales bacterium]
MAYNITEIAERIRSLRTLIGLTPEEMAAATGETPERYLEYEKGQTDFPFSFLYHCAEAFGVDIVEVVTGENPRLSGYNLIRAGEGLPIKREEGFDYYHLAARFKDKLAEPFLVRATYREEEQSRPIELATHAGQEFDYVLTGRLRFTVEGHIEELEPGDSVYYNSGKPHGMIATGGEDCTFLAVVLKSLEEGDEPV